MREPIWIDLETALVYHDESLAEHGGAEGIRDGSALESALAKPKKLLACSESPPSFCRMAAAYACGIARSHPFVDGNKRTALIVSLAFLALHRIEVTASKEDRYETFFRLAEGGVTESQLAEWFAKNSRRVRTRRLLSRSLTLCQQRRGLR
jgi:death on curing protein